MRGRNHSQRHPDAPRCGGRWRGAREELKRAAKRKARKLMPKGLNERLQKEWLFWAEQFAHSRLDRLE
jgi:hypothetical protein